MPSNAKTNRIGSELKAMICAPPGYAVVRVNVNSKLDLELYGRRAVWYARYDDYGMKSTLVKTKSMEPGS
jgi:hypothetical protein